ncbi:YcgJ family protein [Enterobacter kobei]|uniref:YcgJ family protein n=1 Tax=Enterobacter kobei TaxID=208224 RepID=UPI002A80E2A4|nr:YcgJ family protein [Enterobacter kobei]
MNATYFLIACVSLFIINTNASLAKNITFNHEGVLCDSNFCADKNGISMSLTKKYLGYSIAKKLEAGLTQRTPSEFTFSNGVFCNASLKTCFETRYFNPDGKYGGAVNHVYTEWLFNDE